MLNTLKTMQDFSSIIHSVESMNIIEREAISMIKACLILTDGSALKISEVRIENKLEKYSYYWFDEENKLLIGWDNAPHWKTKTFPHHKHVKSKENVEESYERSLEDVLRYIKSLIEELL